VNREIGKVSLDKNGIEEFRSHDEILQASEAYSSCSGKNVNDSRHSGRAQFPTVQGKEVDKTLNGREPRRDKDFRLVELWKS
jgi:hypothetical protein